MYQVSVEYVAGYGEKKLENRRWDKQTHRRVDELAKNKPIIPSGENGSGLKICDFKRLKTAIEDSDVPRSVTERLCFRSSFLAEVILGGLPLPS